MMSDEENHDPERKPDSRSSTERRDRDDEEQDREQEIGVEDSFPASDPPSANVFE